MNSAKELNIVDTTSKACFRCGTKKVTITYWSTDKAKSITICDTCSGMLKIIYGY